MASKVFALVVLLVMSVSAGNAAEKGDVAWTVFFTGAMVALAVLYPSSKAE